MKEKYGINCFCLTISVQVSLVKTKLPQCVWDVKFIAAVGLSESVIKASGLNVFVDAVRSGGGPLAPASTSGCGHEGRHAVEFLHSPPDQGAKVDG